MRAGSMNGTYIDGHILVRDAMFTWIPGQSLMLGKFLRTREGDAVSWFKLDYRYLAREEPQLN